MKVISSALLALIASTNAFTTSSKTRIASMTLSLSEANTEAVDDEVTPIEDTPKLPEMSQAIPFMTRPAALTGTLAGDVGFDPLGFAKNEADLMNYREAEVKHARLAMLAAAGWPISELLDKKIASVFGLNPLVDASDRAPSLLNGGLGKVSPVYWILVVAAAAAIDIIGIGNAEQKKEGYFPGNFRFDPLGVYPKDAEGQKWMQTAEIKNGRLAMIAVTGFAFQEFVFKTGVVDETPLFFKPIIFTLQEYTNSGYFN